MDLRNVISMLLVTDEGLLDGCDWVNVCQQAVAGGATAIQVRHTSASARDLAVLARDITAAVSVPVFVNDRLDVALAVGAAGVHLGADDVPVQLARRVAPPGFLIGVSVGSDAEVAGGAGADYWGIGPLRVTTTKADAGDAIGLEGLAALVAKSDGVPCVAIGGVRPEDVESIRAVGAAGVAVVSGILSASDVVAAAARYAGRLSD
jgi:thiamine-phosphate pyrophosphorylase